MCVYVYMYIERCIANGEVQKTLDLSRYCWIWEFGIADLFGSTRGWWLELTGCGAKKLCFYNGFCR